MPESIRALIIDDEYRARKTLLNLLQSYVPEVIVIGEAANVDTGAAAIRDFRPDLVFLDISMPGKSGFALLEDGNLPAFEVIFTTAHENHAIQAMRLKALDYLVKPIDVDELVSAVIRYQNGTLRKPAAAISTSEPGVTASLNKVVLPTKEGFMLMDLDQVLRCEAASSYTIFHLVNGRQIVATQTLKVFEKQFAHHFFQRVHHKDLVNLRHVERFNARENYLVLDNGSQVNVSLRKKSALIRRLKEA